MRGLAVGPRGVSPVGFSPVPGGLGASAHAGRPAVRRLPPPALDGSPLRRGGVRPPRARLPALRASLFCPTPQTFYPPSFRPPFRPRVRSGSGFPSPSPPPPRTATPTPLPARAPLPAAAPLPRGGAWAAGAGEGTVRVGRCHGEGVLGSEGGAGAGRPRRPWMGGEEGSCGGRGGGGEARGVGRRRSVGAVSPVGASVTGRQRRGSGLPFVGPAAAPGGGSASRWLAVLRALPRPPPTSPASTLSRYLARPGAEV